MEDAYIIQGGNPLKGNVNLSGSKNIALKLIIAALQFSTPVTLINVPDISDVRDLIHLAKLLGAQVEYKEKNTVTIDPKGLNFNNVDLLHGSKIRVSFMLFAPLLHRFKECFVPNPGGCRIGARPIDRIVEGMEKLGVKIEYDSQSGYYRAQLPKNPQGEYTFPKPSHTGTELLILLGVLGDKKVIIHNAALEPEIDVLIRFLNESGGRIERNGATITVHSVHSLTRTTPFTIPTDRNEAVTFATIAVATRGDLIIGPINKKVIATFLDKLKKSGAGVEEEDNQVRVFYKSPLIGINIETSPHPGFMTDWQPNWAVLMTQARGDSIIFERVFENRFAYIEELRKLGADIDFTKAQINNPADFFFFNFDPGKKYNQSIHIKGSQTLHGGVLTIADLRAGATLAIAALIAEGESIINGVSILERGYEDFVGKIKEIGGQIEKK